MAPSLPRDAAPGKAPTLACARHLALSWRMPAPCPPRRALLAAGATLGPRAGRAQPAQVRLLSAGAVEPGLLAALALFTAAPVTHRFATAPVIRETLSAQGDQAPDIVIGTTALLDWLAQTHRLAAPALPIGAVGVGVAVRAGATPPAITDEVSFRAAIEAAEAVVFNRASTGVYMEGLFARLGLAEAVARKAVRVPDGAAVLERIAASSDAEIGFAPVTEILLYAARGVRFAGELPPGLGNRTAYAAGLLNGGHQGAVALLRHFADAASRRAFAEAGVLP